MMGAYILADRAKHPLLADRVPSHSSTYLSASTHAIDHEAWICHVYPPSHHISRRKIDAHVGGARGRSAVVAYLWTRSVSST